MALRSILLATTNPAKLERLRWLLEGLDLFPVTPDEAGVHASVAETGKAHRTNARIKARAWSMAYQGLALASDGGLVIPSLGAAWDSLRTARFAGAEASDRQRVQALLDLLRPYESGDRRAFWVEALALGDEGRVLRSWVRRSQEGVIAHSYAPHHLVTGLWAFTLWHFPELGKRYPELTPQELEHTEGHWAQLRRAVRSFLRGNPQA